MSARKRLVLDLGKPILLTFDAFGTLFKPREKIATLYAWNARRHGLSGFTDDEVGNRFRKAYRDEYAKHPNYGKKDGMDSSIWWSNVINSVFSPFAARSTLPHGLIRDLWELFNTSQGYKPYPDVLPFFNSLKEMKTQHRSLTISVGVVTNSDSRVPSILSSLGLRVRPRRYDVETSSDSPQKKEADIDFVTMSYDVGFSKPLREIYNAAFELSGLSAFKDSQCIHVGDDIAEDYYGALNAGWKGVFLPGRDGPKDDPPKLSEDVVYIQELSELMEMLDPKPVKPD